MADDAHNIILRNLRELRGAVDEQFSEIRGENVGIKAQLADLRGLVLDVRAQAATHADVEALGRRLDVDGNRVDQRLEGLEARIAELERRVHS